MRLTGLTTRGRSLLAAGVAATVTALLLGQPDVFRVGLLLMALPLVSLAMASRTRYRLACQRFVGPPRVPVDETAQVTIRLDNVSRLPTGLLLLEEQVPYALGNRPRFVLDKVEPRGRRDVSYPVRSEVRGRFPVGPLSLRLTDPFGLVELTRSFSARDALLVTPRVETLPSVHLGGEWSGSGDSRARSVAAAGEDDVATREYRHGDDLRRVHWRSTARYGELMVRREEQPWQSRCTILLDTRRRAHKGGGRESSFEWAVSAVASIGLHLARHGFDVRLVTDTGASVSSAGRESDFGLGDFEGMLMDALAVIGTSDARDLSAATSVLRRGGGDGLLVAVLGAIDDDESERLARLRHGMTSAVAVLAETHTWHAHTARALAAGSAAVDVPATLLRRAGWRVLRVSAGESLAHAWPQAARGPAPDEGAVPSSATTDSARHARAADSSVAGGTS